MSSKHQAPVVVVDPNSFLEIHSFVFFSATEIMFFTQEFSSLVCIILQFLILYYLIKIYRALKPSENHQQPLTEAHRNLIRNIAGLHIRHATEHDERQR